MSYPDLRPSRTGHWPRRLTDIPTGVPVLAGPDLIAGWVRLPSGGEWRPEDLIWTPPGTKALDLAGAIVDAQVFPGMEMRAWVTSQLKRRDRYLDLIRQSVLGGRFTLTAALSKMLGSAFANDAALLEQDGRRHEPSEDPSLRELRAIRDRFMQAGAPVQGRLH